jgi:DDE superfamily endonuclease
MRGRKPRPLRIVPHDVPILQQIARSRSLSWYPIQRAQIVLGVAAGESIHPLAVRTQCDPSTIWRTCRRHEGSGLPGLLAPPPRPGRLAPISPPPTGSDRPPGLPGADCQGLAPHPLDQPGPGPPGGRGWDCPSHQILWCHAHAERLVRRGYWVVCVDEKPNLQVLERHPIRRSIPGSIEQREFESTRHGTVNLLVFLIVHGGWIEAACVAKKDAAHSIEEWAKFRRRHRHLRGAYLIHDGDPSQTAAATANYLSECQGWWRSRFTPVHASWLDQAELLLDAFAHRHLKRGSWCSREEFITHVDASWPEYNRRYAHPFEWTWTNHKMRRWFAEHAT